MLVLTRWPKQSIVIKGAGVTFLKLISVRGKSVRLGFYAPDDIKIYRSELLFPKNLNEFQLKVKGDDHHSNELVEYPSYCSSGEMYR